MTAGDHTVTRLRDVWSEHRSPHLVTASGGHAHVVPVAVEVVGDMLRVAPAGRRTRAAVAAGGTVTLVWSPRHDGGYSLIVDGTATLDAAPDDAALHVRPTRAVRHRPACDAGGSAPDGACGADCVELDPTLP